MGIQHNMEDNNKVHALKLVYGKIVVLPIEFEIKTSRTMLELGLYLPTAQKKSID